MENTRYDYGRLEWGHNWSSSEWHWKLTSGSDVDGQTLKWRIVGGIFVIIMS